MHDDDDMSSTAGDDRTFAGLDPLSTLADIVDKGIFEDTLPARDEGQPAKTPILTPNIGMAKDVMSG